MTTYVAAREAIVAHLHPAWVAAYPNVPIFYENTLAVDLDAVPGGMFLMVSIPFSDSVRQGIDATPMSRVWGEVNLRLFSKDGMGVRSTLQVFDFLTSVLAYRKLSGVTLDAVVPGRNQTRDGWVSRDVNAGFSFFQ